MSMEKEKEKKKISVSHVNVRLSISFLVIRILFADLLTTIVLFALYSLLFSANTYTEVQFFRPEYTIFSFILLTLIESFFTIFVVVQWINEYYEISPYEVTHKRGIFFKKQDRYSLQNIKQVTLHQTFFGKMFNYGTINLFDWRLDKCATLFAVHHPVKYLNIFEELLPHGDAQRDTFGDVKTDDEKGDE
jgi:uncharacterized membrane protein YdbT with pleckstrin-like domain